MEYTFEDLKRALDVGHELHFRYNEKKYSISHSQNGWHLCEFYKDARHLKHHGIYSNTERLTETFLVRYGMM